jgi:hypothetical protein
LTASLRRITLPAILSGSEKIAPARALRRSNGIMRHRKLSVLVLIIGIGGASLVLPVAMPGNAAHAQAPAGHRQPRATDAPRDPAKPDQPRSPEDIALERALNNICRGCSPAVPVNDVPRYDIARACPASTIEASDRCRKDEETARQQLNEKWAGFTTKARSDCVQSNEIGGRPSYVQLGICLRTTQLAPRSGQ